jgi:hypothetical protein
MIQRTGSASLPLHGGRVPAWLSTRMAAHDETIQLLKRAVRNAKLGRSETLSAMKRLDVARDSTCALARS